MTLNWTTEKPATAGWYWWKGDDEIEGEIIELFLKTEEAGSEIRVWLTKEEVSYPLSSMRGKFAGPIPEPVAAP